MQANKASVAILFICVKNVKEQVTLVQDGINFA